MDKDPILCLEDDIGKVQVNKEAVVAVFLDIETARYAVSARSQGWNVSVDERIS